MSGFSKTSLWRGEKKYVFMQKTYFFPHITMPAWAFYVADPSVFFHSVVTIFATFFGTFPHVNHVFLLIMESSRGARQKVSITLCRSRQPERNLGPYDTPGITHCLPLTHLNRTFLHFSESHETKCFLLNHDGTAGFSWTPAHLLVDKNRRF